MKNKQEYEIVPGKLRTFLPAKNYEIEKTFYSELGFTANYADESLTVFEIGDQSFYLQDYYIEEWANNFMMFLQVDDVDLWHEHLQSLDLESRYTGIKFAAPTDEHWGRVCRLITPSGVLWHFGAFKDSI